MIDSCGMKINPMYNVINLSSHSLKIICLKLNTITYSSWYVIYKYILICARIYK